MNFFLIPSLGAEGAAIAAFITQTFIGMVQFIYCSRIFNFEFSVKRVYPYLLYVLSIITIFYFFQSVNFSYLNLLIELLLGTFSLFIFKMIDLKELKEQFKMEN